MTVLYKRAPHFIFLCVCACGGFFFFSFLFVSGLGMADLKSEWRERDGLSVMVCERKRHICIYYRRREHGHEKKFGHFGHLL